MPDMRGSISAERGNKYYLEISDRTIVCDSKTLWNFSKPDKKLIISNFEGGINKESSIEQFFFNFLETYKPVSLTEENSSKGKTFTVLKLIPNENTPGIKYLKLYLSKNYDIHSVSFFDGKRTQTWDVNDVVLNKKFPKKYFEFLPPENTSVIDLR
jgi:outer membrane lipoprotein-sorting protein